MKWIFSRTIDEGDEIQGKGEDNPGDRVVDGVFFCRVRNDDSGETKIN